MSVVVDEAARNELLREAGRVAKLTDPELLKIAKRGLSPSDAVADLKTRYPTAFTPEPIKQFSEMTPEERREFERKHGLRRNGGWQ